MRQAYSLVEIAIGLIVIGLLAGATITIVSLNSASDIRKLGAKFVAISTSLMQFKENYKALPGDFSVASTMWSKCLNKDPYSFKNICDGDGDGRIEMTRETAEFLRAWQHMSLSGIIDTPFTGIFSEQLTYKPDENLPSSGMDDNLMSIQHTNWMGPIFGKRGNYLTAGVPEKIGGVTLLNSTTKQINVQALDKKIDDGFSYSGTLFAIDAFNNASSKCTNAFDQRPIDYSLETPNANCLMIYWID